MGHCESDTVARIPLLACLAISRGTIMTLAITALLVKQPASCLALALVPHEDQGGRLAMNRPGIASSGQPRPQHAGALHCVHLHMVPRERKWVGLMAKKLPFWQVTGGLPREPPPMHGEQRPKRARYAAGIPSTFCTPDDIGALYGPREGVRCEQRCLVLAPREDRFAEGLTQGGWWNSSSAPATSYMLSDHGGMMRISDKLELAKIADPQDARFDQNAARYLPRTYPLDEPKFPCFLKCRVGTFSSGVKMLANRSDYEVGNDLLFFLSLNLTVTFDWGLQSVPQLCPIRSSRPRCDPFLRSITTTGWCKRPSRVFGSTASSWSSLMGSPRVSFGQIFLRVSADVPSWRGGEELARG